MNQRELPQGVLSMLDAINQRRSVRDYTVEKPDAATLNRLLAAAVRAPTAMHGEPWAFLIVEDSVEQAFVGSRQG
jgi:nitroreductase